MSKTMDASSSSRQRKRAVAQDAVLQLQRTFLQGQLIYVTSLVVEGQTMEVQVDTGTSDFWLASDKCGTSSCQEKEGYDITLFRDDFGIETGESVQLQYLQGSAAGPIVKSNVTLAGTTIFNQAFLTADDVENEPLGSMQASGVLGLALPINSLIQSQLSTERSGLNNSITDFGRTGSVLPGLWLDAPMGQRFFGLGLQRLPSDGGNGNSTITFGGYDEQYITQSQQSQINWQPVVADDDGVIRRWKGSVSDLFLKINNTQVSIPISRTGAVGSATAILDSGSPLNYANPSFLNALYGAYNVGPSADGTGEYYIDCGLQIDMTVNFNGLAVPIHPLDSSLKYSNQAGLNSNDGCIGAFQSFDNGQDSDSVGADIVLGAPFLRSVYSLYSCDPNPRNTTQTGWCSNPWLGVYPLYGRNQSLSQAESDFQKVRLQGQTLGDNSSVAGATAKKAGGFSSGAKIAIGVVCGLLGILIAMAALLLWLKRKRIRNEPEVVEVASDEGEEKDVVTGAASVDWKKLSENERQKARELAMLHGHFVEDPEGGRASPISTAVPPEGDWDISSKGYWEARAIKNDYLRRERDRDSSAAARSLSTTVRGSELEPHTAPYTDDQDEAHEMIPPNPRRNSSSEQAPITPYKDLPETPQEQRRYF
jgi:hypothetical protein